MDNHVQHLRRGFNWLGGATIVARVTDIGTVFLLLTLLTQEQVGIASLVLSIAMVIEAINELGTSEAMVQAKTLSRLQLDSVFWFVVGLGVLLGLIVVATAPLSAWFFNIPGMAAYFIPVALKQPIVAAASIPLTTMTRSLAYERIAVVNVTATFAAALTRIALALAGTGAWALVVGFSIHGLYVLIGAQLCQPFWPRLQFQWRALTGLLRFGVSAAASNVLQQSFKNLDFVLIGWLYGPAPLAIYRLAFDIAMEPAIAVGELINRTALPVFARVIGNRRQFAQAFAWALRRLVTLVAPLMAALALAAAPLTALLHDPTGRSYADAALPLMILAVAALLRVMLQLIYPVLLSSGRAGAAVRLSAVTLVLLAAGIVAAGWRFDAARGLIAVSLVWLAVYPGLLWWAARELRRWQVALHDLATILYPPTVAIAAISVVVLVLGRLPLADDPRLRLVIVVIAAAAAYWGLKRYAPRTQDSEPS